MFGPEAFACKNEDDHSDDDANLGQRSSSSGDQEVKQPVTTWNGDVQDEPLWPVGLFNKYFTEEPPSQLTAAFTKLTLVQNVSLESQKLFAASKKLINRRTFESQAYHYKWLEWILGRSLTDDERAENCLSAHQKFASQEGCASEFPELAKMQEFRLSQARALVGGRPNAVKFFPKLVVDSQVGTLCHSEAFCLLTSIGLYRCSTSCLTFLPLPLKCPTCGMKRQKSRKTDGERAPSHPPPRTQNDAMATAPFETSSSFKLASGHRRSELRHSVGACTAPGTRRLLDSDLEQKDSTMGMWERVYSKKRKAVVGLGSLQPGLSTDGAPKPKAEAPSWSCSSSSCLNRDHSKPDAAPGEVEYSDSLGGMTGEAACDVLRRLLVYALGSEDKISRVSICMRIRDLGKSGKVPLSYLVNLAGEVEEKMHGGFPPFVDICLNTMTGD